MSRSQRVFTTLWSQLNGGGADKVKSYVAGLTQCAVWASCSSSTFESSSMTPPPSPSLITFTLPLPCPIPSLSGWLWHFPDTLTPPPTVRMWIIKVFRFTHWIFTKQVGIIIYSEMSRPLHFLTVPLPWHFAESLLGHFLVACRCTFWMPFILSECKLYHIAIMLYHP